MQLKVESGSVAPGTYAAVFLGVEDQPADPARGYGAGLKWKWKIESPPAYAGQVASRITGPAPTTRNACGMILGGLAGKPLTTGESVDPAKYVGRRYTLVVAPGKMGTGTRVETCVALDPPY
jgi:hypothetical protein